MNETRLRWRKLRGAIFRVPDRVEPETGRAVGTNILSAIPAETGRTQ